MPWVKCRKVQTFSVPIEKEVTKIDKDGNESVVCHYFLQNKIY